MRLTVRKLPKLDPAIIAFATRFGQECEYLLDDIQDKLNSDEKKNAEKENREVKKVKVADKDFGKVAKEVMKACLDNPDNPLPTWEQFRDAMHMLQETWDQSELFKAWWAAEYDWCKDLLEKEAKKREKVNA